MDKALFPYGWEVPLRQFYADTTAGLLKGKSFSYDGGKTKMVDVVRDVTNVSPTLCSA